jgi:hypothetical protein
MMFIVNIRKLFRLLLHRRRKTMTERFPKRERVSSRDLSELTMTVVMLRREK